MCLFSWADSKIKNFKSYDISLIKIATTALVLMLAKFFPVLTSLEWYWYLIVFFLTSVSVWLKMFK